MLKCTVFLASVMFMTVSGVITEVDWHYLSPVWLLLNLYTSTRFCIVALQLQHMRS